MKIFNWTIDDFGLKITSRRYLVNFRNNIGFTIRRKNKTLINLLNGYKIWKTSDREMKDIVPKIFLLNKEGLQPKEISNELGIHCRTVYNYLRRNKGEYWDTKWWMK
jgi:DNA invertase Pin-like site-specific DNA recombinase